MQIDLHLSGIYQVCLKNALRGSYLDDLRSTRTKTLTKRLLLKISSILPAIDIFIFIIQKKAGRKILPAFKDPN